MAEDGAPTDQTPHDRRRRPVDSSDAETMLDRLPASLMFERLPVPLLLVSRSGSIAKANPAMAALVGNTCTGLRGRDIVNLIPELTSDGTDPVAALAERAGCVLTLRNAEGYDVHARVSPSVLLRCDDPFSFVAFDDVTERLWSS
jgi:PAS domain S-box-containing protein